MRVAVVGGGPGGLFFSRLLKRSRPTAEVVVFEQNAAAATFGFGVTLGGSSLGRLAAADQDVVRQLSDALRFDDTQQITLDDQSISVCYAKAGGSIARLDLLQLLQETCVEVGVELRFRERASGRDELAAYDLIVGADGVNSTLRQERAEAFGSACRGLTNHFSWYGVARALHPNALVFRNVPGGRFIAHYYAYGPQMSTFVAECDEATWRACSMADMSDAERKSLVERVFAPELDGDDLVENRSVWRQFPAITNARWHVGNVVLIGDALRSAHFSIGSGTRLAMEDAAALHEAVVSTSTVAEALERFVKIRAPERDGFGDAAERSFEWYERVQAPMALPLMDFAYDFLTRTGRVDGKRLETYAPQFAEQFRSYRAGLVAAP